MKKLIEVSLPLEAINKESAREKSIRHGHPSTLHLWWARRPLAACRAVLWSSLVDDPSGYIADEAAANEERERLFRILEKLVLWENVNNEEVLEEAKLEIARSVARNLGVDVPIGRDAIREFLATKAPPVLDPFAGGGSIPLEAQRLGLRAYASDLNPVAVLINKALIEIPPKFAGMPPVHPPALVGADGHPPKTGKGKKGAGQAELWTREWKGAQGLAEDVRYYGQWMRDEAEKRIGHLYPKAKITAEILAERPDLKAQGLKPGDKLTVIAWLWARTVKCPNPACGAQMPLVRSFALSTKKGKEAWVEPTIEGNQVRFGIKTGSGQTPESTVNRNGARCICCGTPVAFDYIREEGKSGRMSEQMMTIVADAPKSRIYLDPISEHETIAKNVRPVWKPETNLPEKALGFRVQLYGMTRHQDLFSYRQLFLLTTFVDLAKEISARILSEATSNFTNPKEYANSVVTYLAFAIDKMTTTNSAICTWQTEPTRLVAAFSRQAIPMVWDYAEANPFSDAAGDYRLGILSITEVLERLSGDVIGNVQNKDAMQISESDDFLPMVSTDPPYYDNIGYADLSDYFYTWLRNSLSENYPDLFKTVLVPKAQELIATPFRFDGDRGKANYFFENGLTKVFANINRLQNAEYPLTVFYAFKQSESDNDNELVEQINSVASTGWETMLEGLVRSGFLVTGTWPVRTELTVALKSSVSALASSIVLVCRPRLADAGTATRREFLAALKKELAPALRQLQKGNIAPVDFAQAAIGPGMAVYSRYSAVLEADGTPMRVRAALGLVNQFLDEFLAEQEGEYDSDTRWALAWYEQFGHNEAAYGVAETLSKAKNVSIQGLVEAGILEARAGKVRLLRRDELDPEWDPHKDKPPTAWEAAQQLIYALDKQGESSAAALLGQLGGLAETIRDLAYRLYTLCERKSWAQDALVYNMLVVAWPRLRELAARKETPGQGNLL